MMGKKQITAIPPTLAQDVTLSTSNKATFRTYTQNCKS